MHTPSPDWFPRHLAEEIRLALPALWRKHGADKTTLFNGNDAYATWGRLLEGSTDPLDLSWLARRDRYASRHRNDHRKGGVIAAIKWGVVLPRLGVVGMMDVLFPA